MSSLKNSSHIILMKERSDGITLRFGDRLGVRLSTLVFILVAFTSSAQFEEIVKENFSGAAKGWWVGKDSTMDVRVADGKYKLNLFKTKTGMTFRISVAPDFTNDFILEATFKQNGGDTDHGIGIFWGQDPMTGKDNNFCFTTSGYVRSWTSDKSRESEREWEQTTAVKPLGQENILRIEKTGAVLAFKLNGIVVLTRPEFPLFGDKMGVVLYSNMDVSVDDFHYSEKPKPGSLIEMPKTSELPILVEEDFSENDGEWLVGKEATYESSISDGAYRIQFLAEKGGHYFYKNFSIDPTKDFDIQAEITQLESADDYGFGIVWGYKNPKHMYGFIVCADGNIKIYHEEDSLMSLKPWKKLRYTKPNGTPNIITLSQRNKQWYFLLNDHVIHTCPALKWHGPNVGIEVNKRMKIAVDRITIHQQREPINLVPDLPANLIKEPIASINSPYDEIAPRLSPDGKTLYIVRKHHPNNQGDKDDIWMSELQNGMWSEMLNVGKPLNNEGPNMVVSLSPDNNSLLLMNTYNDDGTSKGAGVSRSFRTATGWGMPVNQTIENYYNDNQYSEICMSANQKVLVFTIERQDTQGERDLYVSFLKPDGTWTEPKNMGIDVNTFADEGAPYLAPDDRTLYFSSAGWPGYGNKDIFLSRRLDDTWTRWSKPQNMGPTINSAHWDSYYTTSASGDYAIVSSTHAETRADLYTVHLPASAKPDAVIIVHGKVLNASTNQPIQADISYEILGKTGEAGIARSNPSTGEYKIILNYGATYGFHAKAKGYISVNENMELAHTGTYQEIEKDLLLAPLSVGQTIKLNNVFFVQSKPGLKQESLPELDRLVTIMKENPTLVIELAGHTDNQGDKKLNMELSDKRVWAVIDYIASKGVARNRMTGKGFGGTKPIVPNDSEAHRQQNRRVEFKIVKS
jgi:outer membrane protein OmpA-like peptidoglycan-associated protein